MRDAEVEVDRERKPAAGQGRPATAPRTDDGAIRDAIVAQLSQGSRYAREIAVDVKDGEVTLSGDVPHKLMKQRLIETALSTRGVLRVTSRLTVTFAAAWPEAH